MAHKSSPRSVVMSVVSSGSPKEARRRLFASAVATILVLTLLGQQPAFADPLPAGEFPVHTDPLVKVGKMPVKPAEPDREGPLSVRGDRPPVWPKETKANVDLTVRSAEVKSATRRAVPGTPVSVGAPTSRRADLPDQVPDPARISVEIAGRAETERAKVSGVLLRVQRLDTGRSSDHVSVEVDYNVFRHGFGGDGASRLRLMMLPACAMVTPDSPQCQAKPLPTRNDVKAGRLWADAPVSNVSPTLLAVQTDASGTSGSFAATPLSASATWAQGGSSGDFTWSYPLRVPPGVNGPTPQIAFSYSSGAVDGRMVSSNNQPSWIGIGFEFLPGSIERKYVPCATDTAAQDGQNPNNNTLPTGDQCWRTDNATISLNGKGSELVPVDANGTTWRMKNDDGTRIERRFDTGRANSDEDGEYWVATTPDGIQYHFGYHKLPAYAGGEVTNSAWTVPVYSNHPGEPGYNSSFAASKHTQAWRWNLDYVVDLRGNTMTYFYGLETNLYGRGGNPNDAASYVRGGWLSRIDYGQMATATGATQPVGRVVFATAERCAVGTTCDITQPSHWPDAPVDQRCAAAPCTNKLTPTFWTTKRLEKITTQVSNGTGGFRDVDSWTLRHLFPNPGDGTPAALWLAGITHTGHVGGTITLPEVTFQGEFFYNRVDGSVGDNVGPLNWRRIIAVRAENGGRLAIAYEAPDCFAPGGLPAHPATNTKRCMPVKWTPEGLSERQDWFHKYVVKSVTESDELAGTVPVVTEYQYLGGGAWKYDELDGLTPAEKKTWSQWRGYGRVKTLTGSTTDGQSVTDTYYFRGMHGNRTSDGSTSTVYIADSQGASTTVLDHDRVAGTVRETVSWLQDGSTMLARQTSDPWISAPTATSVKSWGTTHATLTDASVVRTRTAVVGLNGVAGWRDGELTKQFDSDGRTQWVSSRPDVTDSQFDECTRYWHVSNVTKNLLHLPWRVQKVSLSCDSDTPVAQTDVISDSRTFYDGETRPYSDTGVPAPDGGLVTLAQDRNGWASGDSTFQTVAQVTYDAHGRVKTSTDIKGNPTTTTYVPDAGGPVTAVKTKNPLDHESTIFIEPAFGAQTATVDPNGLRTDIELDALGRTLKVWSPGRTKGVDTPDAEFWYVIRTDGPDIVETIRLQPEGGVVGNIELYDGLSRLRQTQLAGVNGGRASADMIYDSRGWLAARNGPYTDSMIPTTDIAVPLFGQTYSSVKTTYDLAGRPTKEELWVGNTIKSATTTNYHGLNRIDVLPPVGGTAVSTFRDARGNTTALRQYRDPIHFGSVTPAHFVETRYTYDKAGRAKTVVDAADNTWSNEYDNLGRLSSTTDPDTGTKVVTYNTFHEVETTTDARGEKLAFTYDELGRRTSVRDDHIAGAPRSTWQYDTLHEGQLTSSTRHVGSDQYITRVTGYDPNTGRPTGTETVIPAVGNNPGGTYRFDVTYKADGSPATAKLPAAGGLPEETLTFGYNSYGLGNTLKSTIGGTTSNVVSATSFSAFAEPTQMYVLDGTKWIRHNLYYETGTRRLTRTATAIQSASAAPVSDLNYTYDTAGNITKITDKPVGLTADHQCFKYDFLRRLDAAFTSESGDCSVGPTLSNLGTGPAPYWHSWTFDDVGNRKTQTIHAATSTETEYTHPAPGGVRPHTLSSVETTTGGSSQTVNYTYDVAGNTIGRPTPSGSETQTLHWDEEGHLTEVEVDDTTTSSYIYDADGNRLLKTEGSTTTLYLPGMEIIKNGSLITGRRYYSHAGMGLGVRDSSGKVTWTVADHHGTNAVSIDGTTHAIARRYSTPYGTSRGTAPASWPDDKGFVGGTQDSTGLTHLGAREYDPALGRFISRDPIIDVNDPQQMHGYAYSNNNPVTMMDPSGLRFIEGEQGGTCDAKCVAKAAQAELDRLKAEKEKAKAVKKKSIMSVLVDVGVGFLLDMIGVTDIVDCFTKGDLMACGSMILGILPIGRVLKMGKAIAKAVSKGFAAYTAWQKAIRVADGILARADDLIGAAQKKLDDALASLKPGKRPDGDGLPDGAGGCKHSFSAGTLVLMADGTTKSISEIENGDKVIATDPETGKTAEREVIRTFINQDRDLTTVTVTDEGGNTETLETTWHHPFWDATEGRWVDAADLTEGHELLVYTEDLQIEAGNTGAGLGGGGPGRRLTVTKVDNFIGLQPMYDLTVATSHTYYVVAGDTPVLVHNCDGSVDGHPETCTCVGSVEPGQTVYRVWGAGGQGGAGPWGRYWSRQDPRLAGNYRDEAGLPDTNPARFLSIGTLRGTKGVEVTPGGAAPLDGNVGGIDEIKVPWPRLQIRIQQIIGLNPEL